MCNIYVEINIEVKALVCSGVFNSRFAKQNANFREATSSEAKFGHVCFFVEHMLSWVESNGIM